MTDPLADALADASRVVPLLHDEPAPAPHPPLGVAYDTVHMTAPPPAMEPEAAWVTILLTVLFKLIELWLRNRTAGERRRFFDRLRERLRTQV